MLASQQKQLGRSETLRRKESKPLTAEVLAPAWTWVPWKIKREEFEIQRNFESAAEKVGYWGEKKTDKTALSCDVMLASQQKKLGRSET